MTVADFARRDPIVATRKTSIAEVATLMRDEGVGSIVIEEDDRPVGIVTDRDITVTVTAEARDPHEVTAADVMTENPITADVDTGVTELVELMAEHGVRRMPIVDGDELYGIITLDDLARLLVDEQQSLSAVIEAESPPY